MEYLNRATQEQVPVTALQLVYARQGDLEILIPSTFGGEIAAAKTRASKGQWTRQTFLDAIESSKTVSLRSGTSPRSRHYRSEALLGSHCGTGPVREAEYTYIRTD